MAKAATSSVDYESVDSVFRLHCACRLISCGFPLGDLRSVRQLERRLIENTLSSLGPVGAGGGDLDLPPINLPIQAEDFPVILIPRCFSSS